MLTPHRRRNPFVMSFFFASLGIGVIGWYGIDWWNLPKYSETDVQGSVDLNLAVDLARLGPANKPDEKGLEKMRAQIRREIETEISAERTELERGMGMGLVCLIFAFGHGLFNYLLTRESPGLNR